MRKLLILIVLAAAALYALRLWGDARPRAPGENEFRQANEQIAVNHGTVAFGNDEAARAIAERFSKLMLEITHTAFSGGKASSLSTSKGEVLVYCQATPAGYVLLAHVPELRQYHDDVREALAGLAWQAAQSTVTDHSRRLIVALRGAVLYGPVWSGPGKGAPSERATGTGALPAIYPLFAPAAAPTLAAPKP
jgi:hypothetical protein